MPSIKITPDPNSDTYKSPIEQAGWFSHLNFLWILPFMKKVNKKRNDCTIHDIPDLGKSELPSKFRDRILAEYNFQKKATKKKPSMFKIIEKCFRSTLGASLLAQVIYCLCRIAYGVLLNQVLRSLSDENETAKDAFMWAIGLILCIIISVYARNHKAHHAERAATMIKTGLISLIYQKACSLSSQTLHKMNVGKIVNLVAHDVNLLDAGLSGVISLASAPIAIIGSLILLWIFFGPSCLVGFGFIVLSAPLQALATKKSKTWRADKNNASDERVKLTNEVIDEIRLLKMYAWELEYMKMVQNVRAREVGYLKKMMTLDFGNRAFSLSIQGISAFLIFLTFYLTGGNLTSSIVFPTVFMLKFVRFYGIYVILLGHAMLIEINLVFNSSHTA